MSTTTSSRKSLKITRPKKSAATSSEGFKINEFTPKIVTLKPEEVTKKPQDSTSLQKMDPTITTCTTASTTEASSPKPETPAKKESPTPKPLVNVGLDVYGPQPHSPVEEVPDSWEVLADDDEDQVPPLEEVPPPLPPRPKPKIIRPKISIVRPSGNEVTVTLEEDTDSDDDQPQPKPSEAQGKEKEERLRKKLVEVQKKKEEKQEHRQQVKDEKRKRHDEKQKEKKEEKKNQRKPCDPEVFRQIEQLLGPNGRLYVSIVKPHNIFKWRTPAMTFHFPLPNWMPAWTGYEYVVYTYVKDNITLPFIHVTKTEFFFGKLVTETEFDIEHELFLGSFERSCVTDYDRLVEDICMAVIRGLPSDTVQLCKDSRLKNEAIAAAIVSAHPNAVEDLSALYKGLGSYVPHAAGIYVIGGHGPEQPLTDTKFKLLEPIKPYRRDYVGRLLFPKLYKIIPPLFAPLLTPEEIKKAIAKRLTPPEWSAQTIQGKLWDPQGTEIKQLVRNAVARFLAWRTKDAAAVKPLSDDEILSECKEHAKKRFTAEKDREAFVRGATIFLREDRNSPLFKKMINHLTKVSIFVKGEWYRELKNLRFIMSPKVSVRGFCHAMLMVPQRCLFGDSKDTRNKFCVKHLDEEERGNLVKDLFGAAMVINTDYSSMEASVRPIWMGLIERAVFYYFSKQEHKQKLNDAWLQYVTGEYIASCPYFSVEPPKMRLSGQEHTSSGNFLCNMIWMMVMIKMLSGHFPDLNKWKALFEGDDGLSTQSIPLEDNGGEYMVCPEDFTQCAKVLGASLKINMYEDFTKASFCGIKLADARIDGQQVFALDYDATYILGKIAWHRDYDPSTCKHDKVLGYAKALSYLPRVRGNPDLYDAVFYMAYNSQPSENEARTLYFRNAWNSVTYKGDSSELFTNHTVWQLEKFCNKFHLPFKHAPDVPKLLQSPLVPLVNMEVVEVKEVRGNFFGVALRDLVLRMPISDAIDPKTVLVDPKEDCMRRCIYSYLQLTHQLAEDVSFERWLDPHWTQVTIYDFMQCLREDQTIVVDYDNKTMTRDFTGYDASNTRVSVPNPDIWLHISFGRDKNHCQVCCNEQFKEYLLKQQIKYENIQMTLNPIGGDPPKPTSKGKYVFEPRDPLLDEEEADEVRLVKLQSEEEEEDTPCDSDSSDDEITEDCVCSTTEPAHKETESPSSSESEDDGVGMGFQYDKEFAELSKEAGKSERFGELPDGLHFDCPEMGEQYDESVYKAFIQLYDTMKEEMEAQWDLEPEDFVPPFEKLRPYSDNSPTLELALCFYELQHYYPRSEVIESYAREGCTPLKKLYTERLKAFSKKPDPVKVSIKEHVQKFLNRVSVPFKNGAQKAAWVGEHLMTKAKNKVLDDIRVHEDRPPHIPLSKRHVNTIRRMFRYPNVQFTDQVFRELRARRDLDLQVENKKTTPACVMFLILGALIIFFTLLFVGFGIFDYVYLRKVDFLGFKSIPMHTVYNLIHAVTGNESDIPTMTLTLTALFRLFGKLVMLGVLPLIIFACWYQGFANFKSAFRYNVIENVKVFEGPLSGIKRWWNDLMQFFRNAEPAQIVEWLLMVFLPPLAFLFTWWLCY